MVTLQWAAHIAQMTRVVPGWFALVLLVEDRVVNIRPNFFKGEGTTINGQIRDPSLVSLGKRAFLAGIVKIRNGRERSCSQYFADVKCLVSLIRARDHDARKCVP